MIKIIATIGTINARPSLCDDNDMVSDDWSDIGSIGGALAAALLELPPFCWFSFTFAGGGTVSCTFDFKSGWSSTLKAIVGFFGISIVFVEAAVEFGAAFVEFWLVEFPLDVVGTDAIAGDDTFFGETVVVEMFVAGNSWSGNPDVLVTPRKCFDSEDGFSAFVASDSFLGDKITAFSTPFFIPVSALWMTDEILWTWGDDVTFAHSIASNVEHNQIEYNNNIVGTSRNNANNNVTSTLLRRCDKISQMKLTNKTTTQNETINQKRIEIKTNNLNQRGKHIFFLCFVLCVICWNYNLSVYLQRNVNMRASLRFKIPTHIWFSLEIWRFGQTISLWQFDSWFCPNQKE